MDEENIFIKYIPTNYDDKKLYELFSKYGEIEECKVMIDYETKKSLGYGFVRKFILKSR
jgi:RNA recognition motif-containing protein